MQVLWSNSVFMKRLWPRHWCNDVLRWLRQIDCSSVHSLKAAFECGDLNEQLKLKAANCAMFLSSTLNILSKASCTGMPGTDTDSRDIQLDFFFGRALKPECPKPFQPFDTGWDFILCFIWIYFSPFYSIGTHCYGVVMEFMVLLSFFPLMLQYLYIQDAWEFLLYAGCFGPHSLVVSD